MCYYQIKCNGVLCMLKFAQCQLDWCGTQTIIGNYAIYHKSKVLRKESTSKCIASMMWKNMHHTQHSNNLYIVYATGLEPMEPDYKSINVLLCCAPKYFEKLGSTVHNFIIKWDKRVKNTPGIPRGINSWRTALQGCM